MYDLTTPSGCDLRLGDSRLQFKFKAIDVNASCDLRLGDSRLQYKYKH